MSEYILKRNSFAKKAKTLYYFSRGIDDRVVTMHRECRSIGAETTFLKDYLDMDILMDSLRQETFKVCERLKAKKLHGKTVAIKVKYSDFIITIRSQTLPGFTNDFDKIYSITEKLPSKTEAGKRRIRLIGISVGNFGSNDPSDYPKLLFNE